MNRHGAVELDWADGTYTFRLGLAEIEELEDVCDMSVFLLADAMSEQFQLAKLKHYRETLRLGLIGGGMPPVQALNKVRQYLEERPLPESRNTARAVLLASLVRVHTEASVSGEVRALEPNGSTSAPSTEQPS